jgi:hypothetical protein
MSTSAGSPASATSHSSTQDVKPNIIRRPSLIMKPASTPPAASPPPLASTIPKSLTSKEWVIPPRPKPGRKPATDTPPSKRKAQNRAAQRAFRERRAARVNELEEQLKEVEDENDKHQDDLRDHIARLEKEMDQYRTELVGWVEKCRQLETELEATRSKHHSHTHPTSKTDVSSDHAVGCGKCTLETRCQCIDDAFAAMGGAEMSSTDKRPHSPDQRPADKRIKTEPQDSLEIDFTAIYSKPPPQSLAEQVSPTSAVADPCGFCSDGTPCICAEMAAEQEANNQPTTLLRHTHSSNLSQFTPPPSEGDVSIPLPAPTQILPSPCAGGPGTCTQCRADPNSTLFCKSLAASRSQSATTGCCGGATPGVSCCQNQPSSSSTAAVPLPSRQTRSRAANPTNTINTSTILPPPKAGVTLTCADAYTTLSRHPGYERASGEIASWMPKLHASDARNDVRERDAKDVNGSRNRPAMEIDAANVMAVLKDFDRRFGKSS